MITLHVEHVIVISQSTQDTSSGRGKCWLVLNPLKAASTSFLQEFCTDFRTFAVIFSCGAWFSEHGEQNVSTEPVRPSSNFL